MNLIISLLSILTLSDPQQDFRLRAAADNVMFDVLVTGKSDISVPGLAAKNFQVFVDGTPTPVVHFAPQDTTVAMAFLIDSSGSMRPLRRVTAAGAQKLFDLSRQGDEAMLIAFNDRPQVLIGPEPRALKQAGELQSLLLNKASWEGRTTLYDSLFLAFNGLEKSTSTRRAIILFSDGGDNQSTATRPAIQQALRSQSATVYAIGLIDPDSRDLDESFLKHAAADTGGRYYRVTQPNQLQAIQQSIATDIRARYVLAISAKPFGSRPKHSIRVEARSENGAKLNTVHRTAYYSREDLP